nr:PREDICTED: location of vulva defective 1-like isoform X1 [Megachile rotundata]
MEARMSCLILMQLWSVVVHGYDNVGFDGWYQPVPHRPVDIITDVINDLGVRILQQYTSHGNVAFSPTGVAFVLAALYEGSAGRGRQQIADALGLPRDRDITRIGFRDIHRRLRTYLNANGFLGGLTLNQENTNLRPEYEDILRFYGFDLSIPEDMNDTTIVPETEPTEKNIETETVTGTVPSTSTTPVETLGTMTADVQNRFTQTTLPSAMESTVTVESTGAGETDVPEVSTMSSTTMASVTSPTTVPPVTLSTTIAPATSPTTITPVTPITTISPVTSPTTISPVTSPTTISPMTSPTTMSASTEPFMTTEDVLSTLTADDQPVTTQSSSMNTYFDEFRASTSASTSATTSALPMESTIPTDSTITTESGVTELPESTTTSTITVPTTVNVMETSTSSTIPTQTGLPDVDANTVSTGSSNNQSVSDEIGSTDSPITTIIDTGETGSNEQTTVESTTSGTINRRKRNIRAPRGFFSSYPDEGIWMQDLGIWKPYSSSLNEASVRDSTEISFLVNGCDVSSVTASRYIAVLPFAYFPSLHAVALEFPLDDPRYNILLMMSTDRRDTYRLARDLGGKSLRLLRKQLQATWVRATIPSFMLRGFVTLTSFLQRLGILDVFEPRAADLSPMTPDLGVYARDVQQSIGVNIRNYMKPDRTHSRNGLFERAGPVPFTVVQPYLYFIIDAETSVTLIAGRVNDPLNSRIL